MELNDCFDFFDSNYKLQSIKSVIEKKHETKNKTSEYVLSVIFKSRLHRKRL